ncbi:MAG TPA: hypothetical protein PLW96_00625 [Bacteroidales bacterium]|nr:hypothetical protein [Bacteroidales bacterium]
MKKFTLLFCSLLLAFVASANVIVVDSVSNYATKYGATADGDTLLLYSGTYANQNFPVGKAITILAPDTCEVFLTGEIRGEGVGDGSGLYLENITIGDGASYLFNFAPVGTIKAISLKNCMIQNINRCTFYLGGDQASSAVELVEFEGCTFYNNNTGNWNFSWHTTPIYKWIMNECTFYKNDGVESFYNPRGTYDGKSHEFIFTHNTLYQGCRDANRYFCQVTNKFNGEDSKLVFTDNIIICPDGKVGGKLFSISAGYWDVTIKNNLIHGWEIPTLAEELGDVSMENNYSLADLEIPSAAALFADPANGNFSLYKGVTPVENKSTTGGVLGAQKWLKDAGQLYNLTHGLAAGVDSLAGTISGPSGKIPEGENVTLTAVKNYGFKFVKWVDENNATLSEETSYSFEMTGDKYVYAVFDAIPLFRLNITCKGGGSYVISETGKDGAYEYYEEGTELVITSKTNLITEFVMGYTDDMSEQFYAPEFSIVMGKDYTIVLEFVQKDFICGWDFDTQRSAVNQQRPADFLSRNYQDTAHVPTLDMYYTLYPGAPWTKTWWNRTDTYTAAVTWLRLTDSGDGTEYKTSDGAMDSSKYYTDQGFYWQTAVCTRGYMSDIKYCFSIRRTYMGHYDYFVQYSYDNTSWETVDTVTTTGGWQDFEVELPNTAAKELIYIRLIPDVTSGYDTNRIFDVYGVYVANIFLLADYDPNAVVAPVREEQEDMIYDLMGRRLKSADRPGIYIINGKKYLIK